MWIMLTDAFVSIVSKDCPPGHLMVRARRRGDLERLFPGAEITEGGGTDYLFRTAVPTATVIEVMSSRIEGIDYRNFKSATKDRSLHDAYLGVWNEMHRLQVRGQ